MIESYCRNVYNIGLKLNCNLSSINCLCPDKKSYEYLCYQCYLKLNDIQAEKYRLKYDIESGEITIEHCFAFEMDCPSFDWNGYEIINVVVDNAEAELEKCRLLSEGNMKVIVEQVALAMSQAAIYRYREVSYIEIVTALDTEQFINYFWNLLYAIMQRLQNGKDCGKLLTKLSQYISNINDIYKKRDQLGDQFQEYLNLICVGLENTSHCLYMPELSRWQWSKLIENKISATNLEEFIFCCIDTDGSFISYESQQDRIDDFLVTCNILKSYLLSYQRQKHLISPSIYEEVMRTLELFQIGEFDISSIKGLEQVKLQSTISWRANADVIVEYLRKIRRKNMIAMWG